MIELVEWGLHEIGEKADAIIAICALVLSIQQGVTSRRHDRAAARPYLTFERSMKLDEDCVELIINNHGPGSGFIEAFEVFLDGAKLSPTLNLWHELMGKLKIPINCGGGTVLSVGDAIPPQSSSVIARFTSEPGALIGSGSTVTNELLRIRVVVSYKSAFDETQTMDSTKFLP